MDTAAAPDHRLDLEARPLIMNDDGESVSRLVSSYLSYVRIAIDNMYMMFVTFKKALRVNHTLVDPSWTYPPGAPRWRNLTTPSDGSGPITVDSGPATVDTTNEGVPAANPTVENRPSATYPFADISRVPSPTPRGFYDPDDYHRLEHHQIQSLLERRPDPARFDRYAFADQQFADFYQGVISDFANLSNNYPAANDRERDARVAHVVSVTRRFHSLNRVVRP